MKQQKLFSKDFTLIVIGQIISLFGNVILRFALPLYLLNKTGSPSLFAMVSACAFIPMIVLSPIGGIVADRVNKRNVMVILDFATGFLMLLFTFLFSSVNIVVLFIVTLMLLYGIAGAYQPSVQASIPALMTDENLVGANAIINQINSLSNLIGPVAGGALYGFFGLKPILIISIICFLFSAVMEIFIKIPFEKRVDTDGIFNIVKKDLRESAGFIKNDKPIIGKVIVIVCAFNLFLSSLIIVGLPVIITQSLNFSETVSSQLYGIAQGITALGGLMGGILTATKFKDFEMEKCHVLLSWAAILLVPIALSMMFGLSDVFVYVIIIVSVFLIMAFATIFTIKAMTFLQIVTPNHLIGKLISLVMCLSMCSQPLGQLIYGFLFQNFMTDSYFVIFIGALMSLIIGLLSKRVFSVINE